MTEQIKQIAERIKEIREISGISAETYAIKQVCPTSGTTVTKLKVFCSESN